MRSVLVIGRPYQENETLLSSYTWETGDFFEPFCCGEHSLSLVCYDRNGWKNAELGG